MDDSKHTNLPAEIRPKLVRDRIPEIIEKNEPVKTMVKVLKEKQYIEALLEKMGEETDELALALKETGNISEEMADILEILYAISKAKNIDFSQLEEIRLKKREKRGGFDKRLFLLGTRSR